MATWRNGYAEDCKSYPLFYLPTLFPHQSTYLLLIQTARGLWSTPGQLSALKLLKDVVTLGITGGDRSMLNMPQLSLEEIGGLARTFAFYTKFPKNRWNEIAKAEKFTPEGGEMHKKLGKEFDATYRRPYENKQIDAVM